MSHRIHSDEPDTSEHVVRTLLSDVSTHWSAAELQYLNTSGTDNAMWRVHLDDEPDLVVRLPRRPHAAAGVLQELTVLQQIETSTVGSLVATPRVRHVGHPHEVFAHNWSILEWIDGADAWTMRHHLNEQRPLLALAEDIANAVLQIRTISTHTVERRAPGRRGGPLAPLIDRIHAWVDDPQWNAPSLLDVAGVKRLAAEAAELLDDPDDGDVDEAFVHGDLIPGNLLVADGRLAAIIDWGGAGRGDIAQDFAPAWSILKTEAERLTFRSVVEASDAAWIRGRTFELEHAVGAVLYYVPKRHPLGEVMTRTLQQILASR